MPELSDLDISRYLDKIEKLKNKADFKYSIQLEIISIVIGKDIENRIAGCKRFVQHNKDELFDRIRLFSRTEDDDIICAEIDYLAILAAFLWTERRLLSDYYGPMDEKMYQLISDWQMSADSISRLRLDFCRYRLPIDCMSNLLEERFHGVSQKMKNAETLFDDFMNIRKGPVEAGVDVVKAWDASLKDWDVRVDKIRKYLAESSKKLNFVGLSQAFTTMSADKIVQLSFMKKTMITMAFFMAFIPITFLGYYYISKPEVDFGFFLRVGTVSVFEILLLYYFRIILDNFYSISAQVLQLQLRTSVCAFVESYSEFIVKVRKDNDDKTLEKFETLIFGDISSDPKIVPNQFDGFEKIANFFKTPSRSE